MLPKSSKAAQAARHQKDSAYLAKSVYHAGRFYPHPGFGHYAELIIPIDSLQDIDGFQPNQFW